MKITLIAAAAENNVIGKDNDLIWHLPKDLKFFKENTLNKPLVMGRKTFESLPGVLPKRRNIIITRQKDYTAKGAEVVHSIEAALEICRDEEEVMIAGGANIYEQALSLADEILLSRIHSTFDGDSYFPEIDMKNWEVLEETFSPKDEKNEYDITFYRLGRKRK